MNEIDFSLTPKELAQKFFQQMRHPLNAGINALEDISNVFNVKQTGKAWKQISFSGFYKKGDVKYKSLPFFIFYISFTISSVTFLASPNNIMVLGA